MPLNQLLHDEQVTMIRAAGAKPGREVDGYSNPFAPLDDQISGYVFRNRGVAQKVRPSTPTLSERPTIALELLPSQLAGIDHWASVWGVLRAEAVQRLIGRGLGETSHLMRSS
ncbi:hypothetical protein [Novosphingobium sp. Gsoil 351]|uniref:hypothetical protein n=1 Tax=Novosphingobium sp. Gsoil 351 TaxID=2675225 RepID=UPI0012B4F223|nr:hypothetical protein [Novosphingobium sp. Gsoil 351]QGN55508.1 hypothetical protein GKE62_14040 [Novosphingobium sp. Gsoil 351]